MRSYRWAVGASALVLSNAASAQMMELPEIVVTSPSPIAARQTSENAIEGQPWWANSVSMPPAPSFSSVLVMTPRNVLSQGAASLGDTLGTAPGVSATSFSPVASRPVIRGLGGFRLRTQEDGIGSHDMANLGEDHAVTIDPLMSGQVEIIRGPGTLRYGSQATGGVVSANNGRIPTSIPANGVTFQARGGLNSVSNGKDGAVLLDTGGGNLALHLDAFKRSAGDYRIPGGIQENSSYASGGYSVGGSYIFNDGFIGLSYQNATMIYFIPGIDSAREKNHIDLRQQKWTSRGEWRVGQSGIDTIRYWLGFTDYKHEEIDGLGAAAEVGSTFKNREFESRVEISYLPFSTAFGELRGAAGVQWGRRDLSVGGAKEELLAPARAKNLAAFVFEELQITPSLRAQGAVRVERTTIDGTGASFPASYLPPPDDPTLFAVNRSFAPISASADLLYDLPHGMVGRVTAQHVERAPDPIELFYKGPHDTPRTFEIGDPTARINLLHAFSQNNPCAFETPTASFNLLNAELSYTARIATSAWPIEATFGLKGENLLNDDIRFHQSYKKDEVLQPGRNVRLFTSVKF